MNSIFVIINVLNNRVYRIFDSFEKAADSMKFNQWTSESHIIREIRPLDGAFNKVHGEVTITFKVVN